MSDGLPRATRRRLAGIALAAVVVLVAGLAVAVLRSDPGTSAVDDTVLEPPVPMPSVTLRATDGTSFDLRQRSQGRITLLYLGYVNCPDVCPITTAVLARTMRLLDPAVRDAVQVVFVSVDPARDTPEQIRTYLDGFDRTFVGLTAPAPELAVLQERLVAPGAVAEPARPDGSYLVGHVNAVYAFDRSGTARVRFPFGTRQSDWTRILTELAQR